MRERLEVVLHRTSMWVLVPASALAGVAVYELVGPVLAWMVEAVL